MKDTIQQILNWHRAACPEPDARAISVQIGCHYEEVAEMMQAAEDLNEAAETSWTASRYKRGNKSLHPAALKENRADLLDSLCDQIVTALGVGYRLGFDMAGALAEVARSNDSKMVNGTFQYDQNGKVTKPDGYSPPNLEPFLGERP